MLDLCSFKHISKNKSNFWSFVECKVFEQVRYNEDTRSYGVGTVKMITVADEMQNHNPLRDLMYITGTLRSLKTIARAWKSRFIVRVDDDFSSAMRERLDNHHKLPDQIMMCDFETRMRL